MSQQHPIVTKASSRFFHELTARDINYAVIRKAELIPDNIGNDIDILVAPSDMRKLKDSVSGCAKKFGFRIYERQNTKGYYPVLYKFVDGKLEFLRLDFTNSAKNPNELLSRRLKNKVGIYYLPGGVYKKPRKSRLKNIITYPWRFLFPPGKFVVIVGPDGVGKTTTAEFVRELFEAFHIPVAHMHLGFRPRILPTKKSIMTFGRQKDATPGEPSTTPGILRFFYYTADHILGYFIHVRPLLVRGRFVIGERYYYNYIIDPRPRRQMNFPTWLPMVIFRFFITKPDVLVLLSNAPEDIYKRRQEHDVPEIERQIVCYRREGSGVDTFVEIYTNKIPEKVALEAAGALLNIAL